MEEQAPLEQTPGHVDVVGRCAALLQEIGDVEAFAGQPQLDRQPVRLISPAALQVIFEDDPGIAGRLVHHLPVELETLEGGAVNQSSNKNPRKSKPEAGGRGLFCHLSYQLSTNPPTAPIPNKNPKKSKPAAKGRRGGAAIYGTSCQLILQRPHHPLQIQGNCHLSYQLSTNPPMAVMMVV